MPIACTLGLAACMTLGSDSFTAEDAIAIVAKCQEIAQMPAYQFDQETWESYVPPPAPGAPPLPPGFAWDKNTGVAPGYAAGLELERRGVPVTWPNGPTQRKAELGRVCEVFRAVFNDRGSWTHLERWPK